MPTHLLERELELAAVERVLEHARAGRGAVATVTGPAGIGKSAVLRAAGARAEALGMAVATARGWEGEQPFAFGVARQLFERRFRAARGRERTALLSGSAALAGPALGIDTAEVQGPTADARYAVFLGMFWLIANLAAETPLLLMVDDLQWADSASAEALAFAARRTEGVPVAIIVAARSGEPDAARGLLGDADAIGAERLVLGALGESAVGELIGARLGVPLAPPVARACSEATAGNPFLVTELARAIRCSDPAPAELTPDDIVRVGARQVRAYAEERLSRLGEDARELARAVSVLGRHAVVRDAAALAGLDAERAATAADALRRAAIFEPGTELSFAHGLLGRAVYDGVAPGRRGRMHARAASLLEAGSAPVEVVAGQLLRAEPGRDAWAVEQLRRAAALALSRGAPEAAVELLRRAEREVVPDGRAGLLAELGAAETRLGEAAACDHLAAARALETETARRGEVTLALARALVFQGRAAEAFALIEEEIERVRGADAELARRLEAELCASARLVPDGGVRVATRLADADGLRGDTPGERAVLACRAADLAYRGVSAERAARTAERALGDGELLQATAPESPVFLTACVTLIWCDRLAAARGALEAGREAARRHGSLVGLAHAETWIAEAEIGAGRLRDAVVAAIAALDATAETGSRLPSLLAPAWLALARLEQGDLDGVDSALAHVLGPAEPPELGVFAPALYVRGWLSLSRHDPTEALRDFSRVGRVLAREGVVGPAMLPWRIGAARAHAALGDIVAARALADEQLAAARRFGAPRALGASLRAVALVRDGDERIDLQREAVRVLETSEARLAHAHALCDLGASLRRAGARRDGREPLRLALDLAVSCGATALAHRASDELAASGARPRRLRSFGRDALTPAEQRVAQLAAEGLTNREIAQALFVTNKTVETQLSSSYAKLGIRTRGELRDALASEREELAPRALA